MDEVISRIKTLIGRGHKSDVEEYKGARPEGRSGANIRANMKRRETAKAKVVKSTHKNIEKAKAFSFAEVEISNGTKLVFVPTGAEVTVVGDKKIEYKGTQYSLSGFCKVFMPQKNASGAYQGPKYFSYKGKSLLEIRNDCKTPCGGEERWEGKTQLAKLIARRGGNEGAFGRILHYFSRRKPCVKTSKWREPLASAGIKFDANDYVINWAAAKNPF